MSEQLNMSKTQLLPLFQRIKMDIQPSERLLQDRKSPQVLVTLEISHPVALRMAEDLLVAVRESRDTHLQFTICGYVSMYEASIEQTDKQSQGVE